MHHFIHSMINKNNWQLEPFNVNVELPIGFIWISIIVSQVYTCIFVFVCIGTQYIGYILIVALVILDIFYVIKYHNNKNTKISENVASWSRLNWESIPYNKFYNLYVYYRKSHLSHLLNTTSKVNYPMQTLLLIFFFCCVNDLFKQSSWQYQRT